MTMVMPPRDVGMFIAPYVRASAAAPQADVDLPDHLFWALIGHPEHIGLPSSARDVAGAALQQRALEVIGRWHPAIRQLVAESDPTTLISVPLHTAAPVAAWSPSRVTLLGDAIHTMTPLQGLGGNTALRDAALLAHQLRQVAHGSADLIGAIGAYEAAMRSYASEAVGQSLQITQQIASPSWMARLAFKSILRLADRVPPLQRRLFQDLAAA
jgi:2-polyprenyl-6-methoxyphenol hydroxylase-like FAD-dependent oxidoreductase